jgi:hypothetical protein
MSVVLDAGALIAVEAYDREVLALLKEELSAGRTPVTHGGIVGQVWRGTGGRQARLARLLRAVRIEPLDDALGRRAGTLLSRSGTADVIDAALVLLAVDGDMILTSDTDDLEPLATAADLHVDLLAV